MAYTTWFAVPAPIRELFKLFPLKSYPPSSLPERSPPTDAPLPTLHVFTTQADALAARPSYNPSCLKWQAFLRIAGVDVRLVPASNHASPSGALPFLLPAGGAPERTPLGTSQLARFAAEKGKVAVQEVGDLRLEAYQTLLDYRIRNVWLYALYLSPNSDSLVTTLYLSHTSSSLVRFALLRQLRQAAESEILKSTAGPVIDVELLYADARGAFAALSTSLGDESPWFFSSPQPTLFDASVFAYTRLIVDEIKWVDRRLADLAAEFPNLVRHERRLFKEYFEN